MTDILEIKRRLASRAQSVAEMMLPQGRREGHEWRAGSTGGEPGQSLGVHLVGEKAGIWSDFNTGECGDLLDLWATCRGVKLAEAIEQAREWVGLERPRLHRPVERQYDRPRKPKCHVPANRVRSYLLENRNLSEATLAAYRIGEAGDDIVFPFVLPDGVLAMAKVRKAEAGAKPKPTAANCEPVLFGWQAVPDHAREVVITEGEIDAMSWHCYGRPAMSVPYGGGGGAKQAWIESEYDRLQRFEVIYISTDMDEPGEQAAVEIASRLGRHRCRRVHLPHKDANVCLVEGVAKHEMDRCLAEAEAYDPDGLRAPSTFVDAVSHLFWPAEGERPEGYRMPYDAMGENLLFRPGEMTLWSGASGSGKSQMLSDCAVDWVSQGAMICLSSLEMVPKQTLKRMVKQTVGVDRPTHIAIAEALKWLDRGLVLYTVTGKAKIDGLLEVFDYCRARYGCDTFVVDSLMRLGIASDDYTGQEAAVYRLVDWCVGHEVHLHLVAHARKSGPGSRGPGDSEDVKGASEIAANAANVITIWRNREGEEIAKEAGNEPPPVLANVAKQRNGDFEGRVKLWFDHRSYRYRSAEDGRPWTRRYIDLTEVASG
jgi:twinkle protein